MLRQPILLVAGVAILWLAAPEAPEALGAEGDVSVTVLEGWSTVFGGRRAEFHCTVTAKASFEGRASWSLTVGRRTLARGETSVSAGPRKVGTVEIQCDLPQVAEGVVMPAVLSVACYAPNARTPAASLAKSLWIFPENPFAGRSQWLKQLRIHLFDPAGKTRNVLRKQAIPFTETGNVDSLTALDRGVLIIGEGTSFQKYRGLPRIMIQVAAKGIPVLCLAPSDGQFVLPGTQEADLPRPSRITFRRADVIRELDKRLDAGTWPPDGKVAAGGVALKSDRDRVIAQVVAGDAGWPWLEVRFAGGRGKLIVCSFALMRKWDAGPTPRFLFARLLAYANGDEELSTPPVRGRAGDDADVEPIPKDHAVTITLDEGEVR